MLACVLDTETTGLIDNRTLPLRRQPEVIEFYGCLVDLDTGERRREVDHLILPSRLPLPETTVKITHIFDAMLVGKPSFSQVASQVFGIIEEADCVVAHNASFDAEMLAIEAQRLGKTIVFPKLLCTVEQTVHMTGRRLTLAALYDLLFGETFKDSHRAGPDTQALIRCAVELRKRGDL